MLKKMFDVPVELTRNVTHAGRQLTKLLIHANLNSLDFISGHISVSEYMIACDWIFFARGNVFNSVKETCFAVSS